MIYDFSTPRPIRTEEEYRAVLTEIDRLLDDRPSPGTAEDDRLEVLTLLVGAYEDLHYRMDDKPLSPQEMVLFMLDQQGKTREDLAAILGGSVAVSRFLNGHHDLSMNQVRAVRKHLGISADALISEKPVTTTRKRPMSSTSPKTSGGRHLST